MVALCVCNVTWASTLEGRENMGDISCSDRELRFVWYKCVNHVSLTRESSSPHWLPAVLQFPGDETEDPPANQLLDSAEDKREYSQSRNPVAYDDESNRVIFQNAEADGDRATKMDTGLIDLNVKFHCEASNDPPG